MGAKIYALCQQESVMAMGRGEVYPWDKYLTRKFVFQNDDLCFQTQVVNKTISLWFNHLYFLIGSGGIRLCTLGRLLIYFYWVTLLEEKMCYSSSSSLDSGEDRNLIIEQKTRTRNLCRKLLTPETGNLNLIWWKEHGPREGDLSYTLSGPPPRLWDLGKWPTPISELLSLGDWSPWLPRLPPFSQSVAMRNGSCESDFLRGSPACYGGASVHISIGRQAKEYSGRGSDFGIQGTWVCLLPLPLASWVILGRLLDLSFLQSPVYALRIIIPTSKVIVRIKRDNVCVSKCLLNPVSDIVGTQ